MIFWQKSGEGAMAPPAPLHRGACWCLAACYVRQASSASSLGPTLGCDEVFLSKQNISRQNGETAKQRPGVLSCHFYSCDIFSYMLTLKQ